MAMASKVATFRSLATAVRIATRPGGPSMVERAQAVPRLLKAVRSGEYTGTSVGRLLMILGAAGYLVSPVDLLPEGILGVFGLADDAVVGSWLAAQLVTETEEFLAWERSTGRGSGHGAAQGAVPGEVVDDGRGGSSSPRA
ncbi:MULTISPECIES: YkvA family protein [unclassified Knoellia]|uniref:YkvA family protein n=1 Tax=Knoellia altitudinis TaxID=3404795 RepID=UPI00361788A5